MRRILAFLILTALVAGASSCDQSITPPAKQSASLQTSASTTPEEADVPYDVDAYDTCTQTWMSFAGYAHLTPLKDGNHIDLSFENVDVIAQTLYTVFSSGKTVTAVKGHYKKDEEWSEDFVVTIPLESYGGSGYVTAEAPLLLTLSYANGVYSLQNSSTISRFCMDIQ
jgi:hypothetical protein